jgi:hypothetical protein
MLPPFPENPENEDKEQFVRKLEGLARKASSASTQYDLCEYAVRPLRVRSTTSTS